VTKRLAITVFAVLFASACGGDDDHVCAPDQTGETCDVIDCHAADACDVTCPAGSVCAEVDCTDAAECTLDCSGGAICDVIDCRGADVCHATCSGGSMCDLDCDGAGDCTASCSGNSPCLLDCGDAEICDFVECSGGSGVVECLGGILACNRDCPGCGDGICDSLFEDHDSCGEDC